MKHDIPGLFVFFDKLEENEPGNQACLASPLIRGDLPWLSESMTHSAKSA